MKLALALAATLAGAGVACTELNPHFDPDGGPLCVAGERQCGAQPLDIEICSEDATAFVPLHTCFTATHCGDGVCVPDDPGASCERVADCADASRVCSVMVDPAQPDRLGSWCIPSPYPTGRPGGQACTSHEQCQSGWCFRQVCYEACVDAADCTNQQHQCVAFDVTVDGVRDSFRIRGCAP